jgi:hypothetical protein
MGTDRDLKHRADGRPRSLSVWLPRQNDPALVPIITGDGLFLRLFLFNGLLELIGPADGFRNLL